MAKAKKGDYIRIINTKSASWIKKGQVYLVEDVRQYNRSQDYLINGEFWANDREDYEIVYRLNDYLKQIEQLVNE